MVQNTIYTIEPVINPFKDKSLRGPWTFDKAACKSEDTRIFFMDEIGEMPGPRSKGRYVPAPDDKSRDVWRDARRVCSGCPHIVDCAKWGIAHEPHGMWGGLTPRERYSIRRRKSRKS